MFAFIFLCQEERESISNKYKVWCWIEVATNVGSAPGTMKSPAMEYCKRAGVMSPFFTSECVNPP